MAATPTIVSAPNAPAVKSIDRDGRHRAHWVAAYSIIGEQAELVLFPAPPKGAELFLTIGGLWVRQSDGRGFTDSDLAEEFSK